MKITKSQSAKAQFPEIRGSLASMRFPCFGEIKYDGEAVYIQYSNKVPTHIITTNKYGTVRYEWYKLDLLAETLANNNVETALMQGELFYGDGKAGDLYKLLSHKSDDGLNFRIFDLNYLVMKDGTKMDGNNTSLLDRKEMLYSITSSDDDVIISKVLNSKAEAEDYFESVCNAGYEGVVLKSFDGFATTGPSAWVKMKKKDQNVYKVDSIDPSKDRVEVIVKGPNGMFVRVGLKVASKIKAKMKIGDKVIVEHQGVLASGSLRHPVFLGFYDDTMECKE